jgi:hypothetical protein
VTGNGGSMADIRLNGSVFCPHREGRVLTAT